MSVLFAEHFWGEKHSGFDTLCQNLKNGEQSCKDLEDFMKQCVSAEDHYVKVISRLVKCAGSYNAHTTCSFSPVWQVVKTSLEKLVTVHSDLSKKWQDLMKDIHKYMEGLGKKHKTLRDSQSSTLETVQSMQQITVSLQKSKEAYTTKFNDYKKALTDKVATKKVERAEQEFKKATDEYKTNVTKYNSTLSSFTQKMRDSSEVFQETETDHLNQLTDFIKSYAAVKEEKNTVMGEGHYEFHTSLTELSVDKLLEKFVENRGTGTSPPVAVEFEEADISSLPPPPSPLEDSGENGTGSEAGTPTSGGGSSSSMMHLNIPGIFRRRDKTKKGKQKKKLAESGKDTDSTKDNDSGDKISMTSSQPEVDEEGYIIRNDSGKKEEDSWDSSSDSGSDTEEKRHDRKLKVKINPLGQQSDSSSYNSFNKINLKLGVTSPLNQTNQENRLGSSSSDLLDLNSPGSTNAADSRSESNSTPIAWGNDTTLTAEDKEVIDTWKSGSNLMTSNSMTQVIPGLPRPPSRKDVTSGRLSAGRFSPANMMPRQESFGPQAIRTFNSSPSNTDSMPVAVAITEYIHAEFGGSEALPRIKVQGDIMLSFPATILRLLESSSPPKLLFRVAGRSEDQVKVNPQLIKSDGSVHEFITESLCSTLKAKQAENSAATYYNLNIARYTLTTTLLPLEIKTFWKCEPEQTDFRLDYEYNGSALHKPLPLTNVTFLVPINGIVTSQHTDPQATWSAEQSKMLWKIEELKSGASAQGHLKARLILDDGPGAPSAVAAQYSCEGTILSGTEFELNTKQFRVSLTKKRMCAKYLVNTDKLVTYV